MDDSSNSDDDDEREEKVFKLKDRLKQKKKFEREQKRAKDKFERLMNH